MVHAQLKILALLAQQEHYCKVQHAKQVAVMDTMLVKESVLNVTFHALNVQATPVALPVVMVTRSQVKIVYLDVLMDLT